MHVLLAVMMLFWVGTSWALSPPWKVSASKYEKANTPINTMDQDYTLKSDG